MPEFCFIWPKERLNEPCKGLGRHPRTAAIYRNNSTTAGRSSCSGPSHSYVLIWNTLRQQQQHAAAYLVYHTTNNTAATTTHKLLFCTATTTSNNSHNNNSSGPRADSTKHFGRLLYHYYESLWGFRLKKIPFNTVPSHILLTAELFDLVRLNVVLPHVARGVLSF